MPIQFVANHRLDSEHHIQPHRDRQAPSTNGCWQQDKTPPAKPGIGEVSRCVPGGSEMPSEVMTLVVEWADHNQYLAAGSVVAVGAAESTRAAS